MESKGKEICSAGEMIERTLEPFKNVPWMEVRLRLDEIIGRIEEAMRSELKGELGGGDDGNRKGQQAVALDWIRFVEFLRDQCSGQGFSSDRQWGQLMNLLGVSRKLNHRSAKFKDVVKNKQLIQANAGEICELNETVRFQANIERLIEQLKANIGTRNNKITSEMTAAMSSGPTAAVEEICKTRHHLESTCGPLIYSLGVQFQAGSKLKQASNKLDSISYDNWTGEFAELHTKFDRLCQFLDCYKTLNSHLARLSPLVASSFNNTDTDTELNESKRADVKFSNSGSDLLQNSLALCRHKFKKALEFHQKLKATLLTLASQHRNASTGQEVSKSTAGINTRQQQAVSLQVLKLLTARNEYSSDLYSIGLNGALALLRECQDILDKMVQGLRLEYGRFYFINDLELLTIISLDSSLVSQCYLPENKSLISKIFNQSIEGFTLEARPTSSGSQVYISGVLNTIGEKIMLTGADCLVPLKKRVNIYSLNIVRILNEILRKLRASLRQMFTDSIEQSMASGRFESLKSPQNDIDWSLPVQLLELVEQTKFTHRVESVLSPLASSADALAPDRLAGQFDPLIGFYEARFESLKCMSEVAASNGQDRDDDRRLIKLKVSIGVSTTVHFLSILMKLQRSSVSSPLDWNWFKLPRYYYNRASNNPERGHQAASVQIRIANTSFSYKFDLLPVEVAHSQVLVADRGDNSASEPLAQPPTGQQQISVKRLIATETSERCFLVASQSVSALKLGASPFGPAGSGKTETIKALGQLVGCQVIVHNCDETNEPDALERLVWGLAHTGLWGCFDEFNRLGSNTLSRVSEVLELVQSNLRLNRTNVELADGQIKSIDQASAFFITLNPGDSLKYRGRRRLPANLRALFLPIAMVRVQIDSIVGGIMLVFSASTRLEQQDRGGVSVLDCCSSIDATLSFDTGRKLANWIEWTREYFRDSLSNRCEWDLRLVMVILKRFKILVLNRPDAEGSGEMAPEDTRSLIDSNLVKSIKYEVEPRLAHEEIHLLGQSIERFFGNKSGRLLNAVNQSASGDKMVQFSEQLKLRAGVILLGKTRSGKSSCWRRQLKQANVNNNNNNNNNKQGQAIRVFALNPRAYDKSHLYGHFDDSTHKWIDGMFTKLVRDSLSLLQTDESIQQAWIVLDGGVDPDWIECLNSVLDDNQVLTLSSGERLNFVTSQNKHIKLIIETDDISYASPATISRLGLVYFETILESSAHDTLDVNTVSTSNLIIIHGGANHRQRRSVGKQFCQQQTGTSEYVEYNCSELSKSEHLVEILMQNQESCRCYLINNLDLIRASDKWGTRSFIELLRYAITYKCYYDNNMNCINMGDDFKFIITLNDGLSSIQDDRLISLGTIVEVGPGDNITADETSPAEPVVHESLNEFLDANLFVDGLRKTNILLLKTENLMESMRQTCELIRAKAAAEIDLFTYHNSSALVSSMHKLNRLTGGAAATTTTNESANPAITNSDDKLVVFLISSFELKLLEASVKQKLYHSANKLRAMRAPGHHRVLFLIYYMDLDLDGDEGQSDADLDYKYWLSMSETVRVISGLDQLEKSLVSKFKEDRRAAGLGQIDWLASQVNKLLGTDQCQANACNAASSRQAFTNMLMDMILRVNESIESQQRLLSNGLDKLNEFEASVAQIETQREAENRLLAGKKLELESLMSQIEAKMKDSEQKRVDSQELERLQQIKSNEIAKQRQQIQEELSQVLPLIEQSKQEVGKSLRPEALNEIKTLRSPPKTIKDILDVLFIFLDLADTTWTSVKAYLNKCSLRDELTNYDFERRLTKPVLAKIKQEIKLRQDSFQMQQAKRASSAIVPIVKWIEAAIQYGQVLIVMSPLREDTQRLELESKRVSDSMAALDKDRAHLEDKIERDRQRLEELDRAYQEAQRVCEQINCDLEQARNVIRDSKRQTQRWHSKLESLKQLSADEKQLYRLCLICSSVALFGHKLDSLAKLISVFAPTALDKQHALEHFICNQYNVLMDSCDQEPMDLVRFKQHEWHQVLQLVSLKLCTHFGHYPLVPYLICDKLRDTTTDELANTVCLNNIVCSRDDLVILRPFGENANNWRQLAELAHQMNKLTLVKICGPNNSSIGASFLDIFDLATRNSRLVLVGDVGPSPQTTATTTATATVTINDCSNRAITGQIEMMSRTIHISAPTSKEKSASASDGGACSAIITAMLVQYHDPKWSEIIRQLELELQLKQKEARQLELSLVKRLMSWSASSTASDSKRLANSAPAPPFNNDLGQMLANLHQAGEGLANSIADIKAKLNEHHSKQDRFARVSRRAAIFYDQFIANLRGIDQFYSLPLKSYVKILTETRLKNLVGGEQAKASTEFGEAEYLQVITHVMSSMRPNHRTIFQAKLFAAAAAAAESGKESSLIDSENKLNISAASIGKAATLSANFQQAIVEQLVDLNRAQRRSDDCDENHWFKLIVVLHDTKRPSPQVIVDELFRHNNETSVTSSIGECQYYKLYAAGDVVVNAASQLKSETKKDRANPLELQLARITDSMDLQASRSRATVTSDEFSPQSQSSSGRLAGLPIKCVCIANAHLASSWINSRLMELIKERWVKRTTTDAKLLIVLIAESESSNSNCSSTGDPGQFDSNLLDNSELKFWYDELALNFSDRFNLYHKLICDTYIYRDIKNRASQLSGDDLDKLVKDLVLFHVVCQELAKLTNYSEALGGFDLLWQKDYYNFDYEQLCLALKMLRQIVQDSTGSTHQPVRYLFGHLLEAIVYGSRMETLSDEQLLERLLRRMVYANISDSARERLMKFAGKLEASVGEQTGLTSATVQIELEHARELANLIGIVRQE